MGKLDATVTYSKDGHKKKQRRWLDGTLKFDLESRFATLSADDGKFVASGTIPADVEIQDDSEEFLLESPSILVVISAITSGNDLLPQAAPPPAKENTCQPVAISGAALRRPFAPPLASLPPETTSVPTVQQGSTLHPRVSWQQQPQQPPSSGRMENVAPEQPVQHTRPPVKRQERTTEDIMRLLNGTPVENKTTLAPSAVETGNPLKRQRCRPSESEQPFQQQPPAMPEQGNTIKTTQQRVPQLIPRAPPPLPWPAPPAPISSAPLPPGHSLLSDVAVGQWNPRLNKSTTSYSVLPVKSSAGNIPSRQPLAAPVAAAQHPGTVYFPKAGFESSKPVRRVAVSDRFSNADSYRNAWADSLHEEMTLRIAEVAKDFHSAAAEARNAAAGAGASCSVIEAAMRKARVPYYSTCELFIWKNYPGKSNNGGNVAGGRKKKNKGHYDDGYGDDGSTDFNTTKPENVYLILKSGRAKNVEYSKGDLWIVSNDPFMRSGFDPGRVGDKNRAPWVGVARSLWFGPNQDGKFEIEFLSCRPSTLGRSTPVYAIKGPNASMELNTLDVLKSPSLAALPLLKSILGAAPLSLHPDALNMGPTTILNESNCVKDKEEGKDGDGVAVEQQEEDELSKTPAELAEAVIRKFKLNAEQATVVRHVATWANSSISAEAAPPVCLVFGPFGCGKSSLLIAVLHLLLKLRNLGAGADRSANPLSQSRVLVSAHTNVAVDRVLTGLLESGCSDFLRVGPLRRIDRKLLSHSLHASESKTHANAAAELKDMLREGQGKISPIEEAALRAELAAMAAGAERKRKNMIKTVPVVGVTCCSSLLPVLEDLTFDVVILDECSQIIEPLAMAPILRAKAKFLVAAGDPKQLPPVIANPPLISPPSEFGLLRPLFVRLSDLGATPHLLRQQYRCHPALSAIPNAQFYQGRLLDGCTKQQRPSLLPGLPPAVFVDVRDGREQYVMRSTANSAEAHAVVRVVEKAIDAGVDPSKIGVICFYKAQVQEVQNKLLGKATVLQAALEKAAQVAQQQKESFENSEEIDGQDKEIKTSESSFTSIQVATVDAFQGAEKDIIILTTATTRPGPFIADAARLNVALTRAKHNLVVVGCGQALERTAPAFAALIHAAKTTPDGYHVGNLN
ncbi:hypothetical protein Ndes2526B_g05511 [Nannochloris sp. 'desiccata']|nr:hypothetical protein KSW81_007372 [Chlorella desiccata (nom. nud.)]KAH7618599.1 putative Protein ZGRF1 [Chlorella desiccata (nom. nud.)]